MSSSRICRSIPRTCLRQTLSIHTPSVGRRRFLSTVPPAQKSRSWKSSAVRWGLAIGGIYYYNISDVFAEESAYSIPQSPPEEDSLPTIDSLSKPRAEQASFPTTAAVGPLTPSPSLSPPETPLSETEAEADQQGAFNEETGEINWDCPCLGGMAHGPCGEEFRAAFSCFVYSKEEPKGMECIDRFKNMQTCFRDHPDVYGAELEPDDEEIEPDGVEDRAPDATPEHAVARTATPASADSAATSSPVASSPDSTTRERAKGATEQVRATHGPESETDELVPKAAHDATGAEAKGEK